jgi:DNA-binding transcriptional LysR family regulator
VDKSFKEWASVTPTDECVICTVDTAQAALDLVAAGVGIAFIPDKCVQDHPDVRFVPIKNWHQALYMCIYYDKWLEPPVWDFVELLVKSMRKGEET